MDTESLGALLRFSSESRKIDVARKRFTELGLDYGAVTDTTYDWYEPASLQEIREPPSPYNNGQ